ncbi:MAG: hypothetical protein M1831_000103 [Alyxoria varia]|nr:MAG: hypothetical protein M1831_000103 [Alyxoria varia]
MPPKRRAAPQAQDSPSSPANDSSPSSHTRKASRSQQQNASTSSGQGHSLHARKPSGTNRSVSALSKPSAAAVVNAPSFSALGGASSTAQRDALVHVPRWLRFPVVAAFALVIEAVLVLAVGYWHGGDEKLAAVSRRVEGAWGIAGLAGWKVVEVGLAWWFGFDASETFHLTLVADFPHAFLLRTFYQIPILPILILLSVRIAAPTLAIKLFRPSSPPRTTTTTNNKTPAQQKEPTTTSLSVATSDPSTTLLTTLLASTTFVIPLLLAYPLYLSKHLAYHFEGLPTLDPAHNARDKDAGGARFLVLSILFIPLGFSASRLLLRGAAAAASDTTSDNADGAEEKTPKFDPETASLPAHVVYNFGSLLPQGATRALFLRTLLVSAWTTLNASVLAAATLEGVGAGTGAGNYPVFESVGQAVGLWFQGVIGRGSGGRNMWVDARGVGKTVWGPGGWGAVWGAGVVGVGVVVGWVVGLV